MNDVDVARELLGALGRGEIFVEYQPQVDVPAGRVVGVEVLARWTHPSLGVIVPDVFIPLAESTGVIGAIGAFAVEEGLACADAWRAHPDVSVSINVSAIQLGSEAFFDHVETGLAGLSVEPGRVILEITESRAIPDLPRVAARLARLRELGAGISIDDFGVGHSSIQQLLALPASELKLDQSLVRTDDESVDSLVRSTVDLAHDRGITVLAEGVETPEQFARVAALDCDRAQGYLFGKATSRNEAEALLLARGTAS